MMASSSTSPFFAIFLVIIWSSRLYVNGCYPSIISFGDSLADTGNRKHLAAISNVVFPCVPPNGQNFIGQATGRCSNGRLIIDFLAESLGLPLIPPYINKKGVVAMRQGVNYAVAGATALDSSFFETRWSGVDVINASLGVQLEWFKESLSSICGNTASSDCKNFIGRSLVLVGEIGGNDYYFPMSVEESIDEVKLYTPLIIDTIVSAVNELIEMGARTLVIPGNFPMGCSPAILTIFGSPREEYDPMTGCLIKLNEFAEYHNKMLQTKLDQIRGLNPNITIMYADYYNAAMQLYRSPDEYGFINGVLKACYGCGGGFYNFNISCEDASTTLCDDPDTYISWDGIHFTEAAYKQISKSLFKGPYTVPEFNSLCPILSSSI